MIHDAETASAFLTALRKLVRWLGICDGNMEEGSLRCDANISIRPMGETRLGTKVEVKNINSIRFVRKAIDAEIRRQTELMGRGEKIVRQTRGYIPEKDTTHAQRDKEEAHDYRYFPCPDLPPFTITDAQLEGLRNLMPELPEALEKRITDMGLSHQDASVLADDRDFAGYFLQLTQHNAAKPAANWMLGPVKKWLNETNKGIHEFPLVPSVLSGLIALVESGRLNFSTGSSRILSTMLEQPGKNPLDIAAELGFLQEVGNSQMEQWVTEVLGSMPEKVAEYKKGKKGLIGLFVGEVKKKSKGKADPVATTDILKRLLG